MYNRLNDTVGRVRATKAGRLGSMPCRVMLKTWKRDLHCRSCYPIRRLILRKKTPKPAEMFKKVVKSSYIIIWRYCEIL